MQSMIYIVLYVFLFFLIRWLTLLCFVFVDLPVCNSREQKSVERTKSLPSSSAGTSKLIPESGVDMSFWPMIERVNVNAVASEAEMKKFMDALREEYASGMQAHVNLQDLDYMASKL